MGFGLTLTFSCHMLWLGTVSLCVNRAGCGGHGPEPTPDKPSERQGAFGGAQLCTPTVIGLFYQQPLYPPTSEHEQRELMSLCP